MQRELTPAERKRYDDIWLMRQAEGEEPPDRRRFWPMVDVDDITGKSWIVYRLLDPCGS
jgi:hypothetical protein